jgi:hypothetical protein
MQYRRGWVALLLFMLAPINYIDRATLICGRADYEGIWPFVCDARLFVLVLLVGRRFHPDAYQAADWWALRDGCNAGGLQGIGESDVRYCR